MYWLGRLRWIDGCYFSTGKEKKKIKIISNRPVVPVAFGVYAQHAATHRPTFTIRFFHSHFMPHYFLLSPYRLLWPDGIFPMSRNHLASHRHTATLYDVRHRHRHIRIFLKHIFLVRPTRPIKIHPHSTFEICCSYTRIPVLLPWPSPMESLQISE